jgi:hypothetical protein
MVRVALLEARVRLIVLTLKGIAAVLFVAAVNYFLKLI